MIGLVIIVFFAFGAIARLEWNDYKRYNPDQQEGVYRITFDRFLEIYKESSDYIRIKEDQASYSNGWDLRFVFSFTYGDWKKYQKWYQDRIKAQVNKKNDSFLKQCDEEFEKHREDAE